MKSLLLVLHRTSPVIHGHRFLRTLFNFSGACLSTQVRNIFFHSRHMPFGSEYKSTLSHGIWLRSLKNLLLSECLASLCSARKLIKYSNPNGVRAHRNAFMRDFPILLRFTRMPAFSSPRHLIHFNTYRIIFGVGYFSRGMFNDFLSYFEKNSSLVGLNFGLCIYVSMYVCMYVCMYV